jgi:hypothetical protein
MIKKRLQIVTDNLSSHKLNKQIWDYSIDIETNKTKKTVTAASLADHNIIAPFPMIQILASRSVRKTSI